MCAIMWRCLVKATEVSAGLAKSNGSLPPGRWLKVTSGLGSAPGPTLGNEYGRTLPLPFSLLVVSSSQRSRPRDILARKSGVSGVSDEDATRTTSRACRARGIWRTTRHADKRTALHTAAGRPIR